jgi:hypothetical protein
MKYRGYYRWQHDLKVEPDCPNQHRPQDWLLLSLSCNTENSISSYSFQHSFEFESEEQEWEKLREIIMELFEADTRQWYSERSTVQLNSIHIEEVKKEE